MTSLFIWATLLAWMMQVPTTHVIPAASSASATSCIDELCGTDASSGYPVDANFTWVNQGTATKTATSTYVILQDVDAGGDQLRMRVLSAPATPYTVTLAFNVNGVGGSTAGYSAGFVGRQSGDGKAYIIGCATATNVQYLAVQKFSSSSAWNSNVSFINNSGVGLRGKNVWVRYTDDGTNRRAWSSADGVVFNPIISTEGRTTYLTIDQVGFYLDAHDSNASMVVRYFKVE